MHKIEYLPEAQRERMMLQLEVLAAGILARMPPEISPSFTTSRRFNASIGKKWVYSDRPVEEYLTFSGRVTASAVGSW